MSQLLVRTAEPEPATVVAGARFHFSFKPSALTQPRSVFVSDLHLGCKFGNTERFYEFLCNYQPEYLYLVGDILDGWRLSRQWYWTDCYSQIIHRLNRLAAEGTKIFYTPGNHDEFLRSFLGATVLVGNIQIADEFVHLTADRRRLMVTHGDQFDKVVGGHPLLSCVGDRLYNLALLIDQQINRMRSRLGRRKIHFSKYLKRKAKQFTNSVSGFEAAVVDYARRQGCDGIVCGHIHQPEIKVDPSGIVYYNTGDWVENASAIIESSDGRLEIFHSVEGA